MCVCVVFLPLLHTELNAALEINQERGGYLWMEWNGAAAREKGEGGFKQGGIVIWTKRDAEAMLRGKGLRGAIIWY